MRYVAPLSAIAGLALAVFLFMQQGVGAIVALVLSAGPGLLLAALFHILPMVANARAWQRLLPETQRPALRVLSWATWLRESVNGLLPVARIGGEIVAYRAVRRYAAHGSELAASLVADMALSLLSQTGFAVLGLALLFARGRSSGFAGQLLAAVAGMIPLGVAFIAVQRAGALSALTRIVDRLFAGRFEAVHASAVGFDAALAAIYARRRDVAACFAWQLAGWTLGAGEIWLALYFLGQPMSVLDALAIEALIQALSSAAFIGPAALGVQEGGFVVIGAMLGIDAGTSLALATARRLREVVIFLPGLAAWQWAETRVRHSKTIGASQSR
jgi:putative membrane protein